jgi:thiol-disulfide isomerase/thioredoxin
MKKVFLFVALMIAIPAIINAQTTAMDFNRMDCNGNTHHLFADLDSGKVVILEYFMGPNCSSCEDAAKEIDAMKTKFLAKYPGKVMSYAMGFQNSYSCSIITTWVSNLGVSAIPMDSGALQVAYYGGFAMPTIAVVAGSDHKIIYTANANNGGYTNGDTSKMSVEMNKFFNPTGVKNVQTSLTAINIFPNPSSNLLNIEFDVKENANVNIKIVDIMGKVVKDVLNENIPKGHFIKTLQTNDIVQGFYMVNISVDGVITSNKIKIHK